MRRGGLRRAAWAAVVASAAVVTVGSVPASAVVGGSSSAVAVDVALAVNSGSLAIDAAGRTAQVDDPATNGTNSSGASASVVGDAMATASTSVINATATRGPSSMSATSELDGTAVTLFGDDVLTAGDISSAVECPLVGAPTAAAAAIGVTIGAGPAVSLSSSGTTATSGTALVTDVMFVGGTATVDVTATTTASTGGTSAAATGLQITLSFASGVLVGGGDLAGVSIGTVVLADTACEDPTGPDPVASAPLAIVPDEGSTTGGTITTLTGSGFTGATGVTFGGAPGTAFTVVDDATITVTTPAGAVGPADVVITDPAGNGTLLDGFTYIAPSAPLAIVPDEGPTTGGTSTTLTGSGFTGATGVTFEGAPGTAFTVVDDATITVTTPAGALGPADVVVVDAAGNGILTDGFTYRPVGSSTVLSLDPPTGPTTGATPVTITGFGFTGATGVTFDGVAGSGFVVVDDTTITVTTPPGTVGPADVVVSDPSGDGRRPAGFTYIAPAAPTSITPDEGPTTGGTATTITGAGLTGATGVTFDGVPGTGFVVVDDATITVTTPAGLAGPADVLIVDPAGNGNLPAAFAYFAPAPSAPTSITPDEGPTTGGTATTISGSGFTGATGVTFDGVPGAGFVVVNDATITVTTPAGSAGPADVVVTDASGDGTLPAGFTYTTAGGAAAAPASISPTEGSTTGGTRTTIRGARFTGATGVTFDGVAGTDFVVVDDATITVTAPPGTVGPADVVVTGPAGSGILPAGFRYLAPSVPTSVTPATSPTSGGTQVTIRGTGFTGATGVTFDGVSGTDFLVVDDATIVVTTPPGTAGPADIVVLDPAGDGGLAGGVSYIAPPAPGGGTLPRTGTTTSTGAIAATIALLAGLALSTIGRRRRRHPAVPASPRSA